MNAVCVYISDDAVPAVGGAVSLHGQYEHERHVIAISCNLHTAHQTTQGSQGGGETPEHRNLFDMLLNADLLQVQAI